MLAARTHLVPKEGRGRGEKIAGVVREKKKGGSGERTEADRPPAVQPKEKSSTILFPRQPPKSNCGWTNLEQHCKQLAVGGPDRGFFSKRRIKCRIEKKALLAAVLSSPRVIFFLMRDSRTPPACSTWWKRLEVKHSQNYYFCAGAGGKKQTEMLPAVK